MKKKRVGSRRGPIDSKDAGLRNEKLVIALLRQYGELSQAQLRELAGVGSSTASYIVGRLREKNLIVEKRGNSSKRGAKPVIVSIRPRAQLAVGVDISPTSVLIGLFDFNGELIEDLRIPIGELHSPEVVANLVEINVRGLLGKHEVAESNLVGIGATVSGAISADGVVQLSSPMGWKDVRFREMLQERFQAPVHVFSTRVRLFAEIGLLPSAAARHLVLLNFADGVGATIADHSRLLLGATNRTGEIGHIIFDPNGPPCGCGHRGCLETFASGPALAKRIREDLASGAETMLRDCVGPDDTPKDVLHHLGRAIAADDPYALQTRDLIGDYVSRATAMAINCYDPDMLILSGYVIAQCPDYFVEAAQRRVASDVFDHYRRKVTIVVAKAGEQALIRGVAAAVLRSSLEHV